MSSSPRLETHTHSPTEAKASPAVAALLALLLVIPLGCQVEQDMAMSSGEVVGKTVRFRADGTFTIVQFTDTQDDQDIDPRTVRLMEAVLDDKKPDLVVFTGDNVRSGPETTQDVWTAIEHIAAPLEEREIPWLIAFGNHDEDHTSRTGVDRGELLERYMSYPNNLNRLGPQGVHGTGNFHQLILGSIHDQPVFNIWSLDSGGYSPDTIAGQVVAADGLPGWDIIRPDQVSWYYDTSLKLEESYGTPIPALAFFHIPLQEFHLMWENRENHTVVGEKNEEVSAGPFNSGLFAAMLDRGDVKGIFVGHDHVNDYAGDYFGIRLGYAANAGFGTYGLAGDDEHRLRGARVFVLRESDPGAFETHMVYARDYGIQ
jgi:hypothetical protein